MLLTSLHVMMLPGGAKVAGIGTSEGAAGLLPGVSSRSRLASSERYQQHGAACHFGVPALLVSGQNWLMGELLQASHGTRPTT